MSKPIAITPKLRPFAVNDIVEISFLHLPVAKKLGNNAIFTARIRALYPVEDYDPVLSHICPPDDIDRRCWQILHWEQRSANRHGMVILPAEGQNVSHLPRVRFIKRPR